jgi:hypothetical protein
MIAALKKFEIAKIFVKKKKAEIETFHPVDEAWVGRTLTS